MPANSFSEYAPEPKPETKKKDVVWFALNDERPLFAFAGIWTEFKGDRGTKSKPVPGPHEVYGFLTTAPNAVGRSPYSLRIAAAVSSIDRRVTSSSAQLNLALKRRAKATSSVTA